jgi:hypothetical protein
MWTSSKEEDVQSRMSKGPEPNRPVLDKLDMSKVSGVSKSSPPEWAHGLSVLKLERDFFGGLDPGSRAIPLAGPRVNEKPLEPYAPCTRHVLQLRINGDHQKRRSAAQR